MRSVRPSPIRPVRSLLDVTVVGVALAATAVIPLPAFAQTPTPPPPPACAQPDVMAASLRFRPPVLPAARLDGRRPAGTVLIALGLDPTGAVTSAIVQSGDEALRSAALATARGGTYRAEVRGCAPRSGTYLLTVDYQRPPIHRCPMPPTATSDEPAPLNPIGCVTAAVGEP